MASLTDVARAAEVSIATASIVLSGGAIGTRVGPACVERVRAAAAALGYVPNYHARSMKSGRADAIAVALDFPTFGRRSELVGGYYGSLLGAIEVTAREAGLVTCILGANQERSAPDRCVEGLRQRRFDGAIMPGPAVITAGSTLASEPLTLPIAIVHHPAPCQPPVVEWDEAAGVAMQVAHLSGLGHRTVAWLGPVSSEDADFAGREALFRDAVAANGMRCAAVRHFPFSYRDHYDAQGREVPLAIATVDAANAALASDPRGLGGATAIATYNDATAIGACMALAAAGIAVPADMSVIGIDDLEAPFCVPRLTTVSQRVPELGRRACELVLRMVADPEVLRMLRGHREVVSPELVVRASTAPPR